MKKDISGLIEAVNRVGIQNISLLSRMTGMPTETIRYTVKKRFPRLGLSVRTPVNHALLGLERNFITLRLAPGAALSEETIVKGLSSEGFLTYVWRAPIEQRLVAYFSVPVGVSDDFLAFLDTLVQEQVLTDYTCERLEWSRHPELKSKYYSFSTGKWSIDWEKIGKGGETPPNIEEYQEPAVKPDIDHTDTLIIKELEIDSWRNIAEIARKLKLNERTVRWHYKKHVSGTAQSNYVNWIPVTPRDFRKAVCLVHEFRGVSSSTLSKLRVVFNSFPFCWFEAGRKDGYYQVNSALPPEYLMESLRFLNASLEGIAENWKTWTVDLATVHHHTIPYQNYDDETGWSFNREAALKAVLPQKMKIK